MQTCQFLLITVAIGTGALLNGQTYAQNDAESAQANALKPIIGDAGNERENKIIAALNSPAELDHFETRMEDIVHEMMSEYRIPIVMDESAADNNLDAESLITITLQGVKLRSALRIMLQPFLCTYMVKNEVLYIVSEEVAAASPVIRHYDCRDLIQNMKGDVEMNFEKLVNGMKTVIDPESWRDNGGTGDVAEVGGLLFIRQTTPSHDRIEHYLNTVSSKFPPDDGD